MKEQIKKLRELNNRLDKKLLPENDKILTDIIIYLRVADISEQQQELVRNDLLEMVLSAQDRGENIDTVIGEDYKDFCDNIIANLPHQSKKEKLLGFLDTIFLCITILGVINIIISKETILIIKNLFFGEPINLNLSISIGTIITFAVIIAAAFIIVNVICKSAFKETNKLYLFLIGSSITAFIIFLAWIGRSVLFTVNIFAACAFVIIAYIIHRILASYY